MSESIDGLQQQLIAERADRTKLEQQLATANHLLGGADAKCTMLEKQLATERAARTKAEQQAEAAVASCQWKLVHGIDGPAMVDRERQELNEQLAAERAAKEAAENERREIIKLLGGQGEYMDTLTETVRTVVTERNAFEGDVHDLNRKNRELERDVAALTAELVRFKTATMLEVGGDPETVAPEDLERSIQEYQHEISHKDQVNKQLTAERDGLHDQCAHWEKIAQRLASDALVALSRTVATPEKGYLAEPHCLRGDIGKLTAMLRRAQDALKSQPPQTPAAPAASDERLVPLVAYLESATRPARRDSDVLVSGGCQLRVGQARDALYALRELKSRSQSRPAPQVSAGVPDDWRPTGRPIKTAHGGSLSLTVDKKRDGLIRLSFSTGREFHPMTWDFTPEQAAELARELPPAPPQLPTPVLGVPVEVCERLIKRFAVEGSGWWISDSTIAWFKEQVEAAKRSTPQPSSSTDDQRLHSYHEYLAQFARQRPSEASESDDPKESGRAMARKIMDGLREQSSSTGSEATVVPDTERA